MSPDVPGPMLDAAALWVGELQEMGRVESVDSIKVAIVFGIAARLDQGGSGNANLWEQFRAAVADLSGGTEDDGLEKLGALLGELESKAAGAYTPPVG